MMAKLFLVLACVAIHIAAGEAAPEKQTDANAGQLKMALVSMRCVYSDSADAAANKKNIQANLGRHIYFIDKLAADGAEFIGFPEASINGYRYSANTTWLSLDGPEVKSLQQKAVEKRVYICAGMAEQDASGKRYEAQIVIAPDGKIAGVQRKHWLTGEKGFCQSSTEHNVFDVKGVKMGIVICADGSDFNNLKALADAGAKIIFGPHCNSNKSTTASWYAFRGKWGGVSDGQTKAAPTNNDGLPAQMPTSGWISQLKVHAALVNHAGSYNADFKPPEPAATPERWSGGAWFIAPDGATLAQMPSSQNKSDSIEFVLIHSIPIGGK
jgi:predicted amidohydrolase